MTSFNPEIKSVNNQNTPPATDTHTHTPFYAPADTSGQPFSDAFNKIVLPNSSTTLNLTKGLSLENTDTRASLSTICLTGLKIISSKSSGLDFTKITRALSSALDANGNKWSEILQRAVNELLLKSFSKQ